MFRGVIFDLDDTLYPERDYCRSGFAAVARVVAASWPSVTPARVADILNRAFDAGNRRTTFNAALDALAVPADAVAVPELVEVYRTHRPQLSLPDESRQVLDALAGRYRLGLLTDGFLPAQRLKVEALGLTDRFVAVVYTEQLGRACWKPSPVGFERLCEQMATSPSTCVYVGDNPAKDFVAPNALGMVSIMLRRPDGMHAQAAVAPGGSPAHVLERLAQLPDLLARLERGPS